MFQTYVPNQKIQGQEPMLHFKFFFKKMGWNDINDYNHGYDQMVQAMGLN